MESLGARLGRSSTRYGPAAVFSGPVRKWKKKWVPLSSSSINAASNPTPNSSNLLLYKWILISSHTSAAAATLATAPPEQPPRKKFRYIPVCVTEERKQEAAAAAAAAAAVAKSDDDVDERKVSGDAGPSPRPTQSDVSDGKPDVKDHVSMEEAQETPPPTSLSTSMTPNESTDTPPPTSLSTTSITNVSISSNERILQPQPRNTNTATCKDRAPADDSDGTSLDLTLGFKANDGDLEMTRSGEIDAETRHAIINSEAENREEKSFTPDLERRV